MGELKLKRVEQWLGKQGDVKPINPPQGSTYKEAETGKCFLYLGNQWILTS